jgi:hypothetical protein
MYIAKFVRPEQEIPEYIANYRPEHPSAPVSLNDLRLLAERACVENPILVAWASNAGGEPHIGLAGKGMDCRHRVSVDAKDSFVSIMTKITAAAVTHCDDCLGRAEDRMRQATLSLA